MKIFKGALCTCIIVMAVNIIQTYSQINLNVKVSATNYLRYGVGVENSVTGNTDKKYFEELGDVRLFVNDFIFGVRYEYDDPIEYGKGYKAITRRFFEFKKEEFNVRAGHFYEVFGKGLTYNAFENRPLGYNTQTDGVKLYYKHTFGKNFKIGGTFVGGGIDYTDIIDTSKTEHYSIRAGNFSISPFKFITLGGSYLYTNGQLPVQNTFTNITAEIFEGNVAANYKNVDLYVAYANKVTISDPNAFYPVSKAPRGDGGYGSLSITSGGLGILVDYKDYRFNLVKPNERSANNPYKTLPFQNMPTCIKEYGSTLLSRYPHNPDFGDEVGGQFEIIYTVNDKLTFDWNMSLTSRHYDYKDIDTTAKTSYERIDRSNAFLPSTADALSPYWETYFEAEYYVNKDLKTKLGLSRKFSVLYNNLDPENSETIKTITIPLEIQYNFAKKYSVKLNAEFQQANNNLRTPGKESFYSQYTTISVSRSPDLIFAGNVEFTNDEEDPSGKQFWGFGELTYKFSGANTLTISYGSERGGIKCSSGICRYVNPFNGFRLTVLNNF
jgi:hypothetical protein